MQNPKTPPYRDSTSPSTSSGRANATLVFLCRNSDLAGVVSTIQQVEDRFNKKFGYPWVLLNDEEFTDYFKTRVSVLTDAPMQFGLIPREHWVQPDWIDEGRAQQARRTMKMQGVIYGDSVSYRNMCRFNSGFFYKHSLLQPYRYYWRVEPSIKLYCDLDYDPFLFMEEHKKTYGFTITFDEIPKTVPTLWDTVKEFMKEHPEYIDKDNGMDYLSEDHGLTWNLCHFWSNFEIADMDFWRSEAYEAFFGFLESKGGFYYERWGDAPVHSIAAALFQPKDRIHFFSDIGYRHDPFQHCPRGYDEWRRGKCACDRHDTFDYAGQSCLWRFEDLFYMQGKVS
ncbi:glycosyltransferase family 15 protein [Gloeophyllum trabeum ATCC 11539]|uniref:Glycosyltransferase family 15 protein n=1 Tax=Gloeophyllum trabeum (strain ATCC 11539 / FP-39264 / Madison 617) TaxID=670483 RepID=S7PUZ2_GLOTA|nr:glycosyltransferase family 15 protein [Gloeophyllum trabeum ATCC 11539]EPQ51263.1 glycosyltransferase family 15 protein [Gloeophyllum trabeum ATCC 11539]